MQLDRPASPNNNGECPAEASESNSLAAAGRRHLSSEFVDPKQFTRPRAASRLPNASASAPTRCRRRAPKSSSAPLSLANVSLPPLRQRERGETTTTAFACNGVLARRLCAASASSRSDQLGSFPSSSPEHTHSRRRELTSAARQLALQRWLELILFIHQLTGSLALQQ